MAHISTQEIFKSSKHIKEEIVICLEPGKYSVPSLLEKALGNINIKRFFDDELMKNLRDVEKVDVKKFVNLKMSGSFTGNQNLDLKFKKLKVKNGKVNL